MRNLYIIVYFNALEGLREGVTVNSWRGFTLIAESVFHIFFAFRNISTRYSILFTKSINNLTNIRITKEVIPAQ
jgi:hypothetical protein